MNKALNNMTNEELWQLFPVIIVEHDNTWESKYIEEEKRLITYIGKENIIQINQIGSTAVPNLLSKPTIDILVEVKNDIDIQYLINKMTQAGYIFSPQPDNPAPHAMLLKGYTPQGFVGQAYHVHVRYKGDWNEIYFRDYLIKYPAVAKEYGELKLKLKDMYKYNRDAYTVAKTEFIQKITNLARTEFLKSE